MNSQTRCLAYKIILVCIFIFSSKLLLGSGCAPKLKNAKLIILPENVAILERQLSDLNDEFQRLDPYKDDEALSAAELNEIGTQEITLYKNEYDIRLIYLSRLKALRTKIVEKLVDLYLIHYQSEIKKAEIRFEEARKLFYSVIEFTKIRQFNAENMRTLIKLSKNCDAQMKTKEMVDELHSQSSQLERVISVKDHTYARTILLRLVENHGMKISVPTKPASILNAATEAHKALVAYIEKTVREMNQRNQEIKDELAEFPEYEAQFDTDGFENWVAQSNNDRRYLDALITLNDSFVPNKDRIPGCCGRPCGLTCPYLTSMMIPIPTLDKIPARPRMAVYRTFLVFQEMVPNSVLPYPARPSILRQQLRAIRTTP